jgi:tetratricopeptide (TPR) repeat protein
MSIQDTMQTAAEHFGRHEFEQAAALYEQVLQEQPDHAEALGNLGAVSLLTKDHARSETCYRRAREAAPNSVVAGFGLAKALLAQQRYDEALQPLQDMNRRDLLSDADQSEFLKLIGIIHAGKQDWDVAINFFSKYRDRQPDDLDPYLCLRNAYLKGERIDDLADLYETMAGRFPDHPEARTNLVRLRGRQGGYHAVRHSFDRVLQVAPHDLTLYNILAVVSLESRQYAYAYLYYLRARRNNPDADLKAYPGLARLEVFE